MNEFSDSNISQFEVELLAILLHYIQREIV